MNPGNRTEYGYGANCRVLIWPLGDERCFNLCKEVFIFQV